MFSTIQEPLFAAWENLTDGYTVQQAIEFLPAIVPADLILSQHFFQPNAAGGVSPVWDFRATAQFSGSEDAFFVGKGKSSLPAPVDPANNINWLDVSNVAGSIATEVFRVSTLGGQPPTSVSQHLYKCFRQLSYYFSVHGWVFAQYHRQVHITVLVPWPLCLILRLPLIPSAFFQYLFPDFDFRIVVT